MRARGFFSIFCVEIDLQQSCRPLIESSKATRLNSNVTLRTQLLSSDPAQQARLTVWAMGAFTYVMFSGIQILQVSFGFMDEVQSNLLIAAMLCTAFLFYVLIRSGWNLRFRADPSLTMVQLSVGAAFGIWSYAITGPARGAILLTMMGNLVYGIFALTPRQARWLCWGLLGSLALTMLYRSDVSPAIYPPRVELVYFLFAVIVMFNVATLSGHLSAMRSKMGKQSKELKLALEQVRLLATRDELTQIHNRRHMVELMGLEQRQHERSGAPLCLALLDIDMFKSVNDGFGHAAGDLVLQRFAAVMTDVLRTSDLVCRWGGEEFLVMFPETPPDQAIIALQRVHAQLKLEVFDALPADYRVTFSAGLTRCQPGEAIEIVTERADQAMYRAKSGGRNRTEVA